MLDVIWNDAGGVLCPAALAPTSVPRALLAKIRMRLRMDELAMPPLDFTLSPITGWTRAHWVTFADQQLLAIRRFISPSKALVNLPGRPSWSGPHSDGMEGFARTFLLAAFRVAGEQGDDPHGHLAVYRDGLLAATEPGGANAWLPIEDRKQPMVEAASMVIALELTKPWLWNTLTTSERDAVAHWLQGSSTSSCVDNNWVLFQVMIAQFLANAGYGHNAGHIEQGLSRLEDWYAGGGWYRDGDNGGSGDFFDYYCGWAMHLYPLLWSTFAEGHHDQASVRRRTYTARLADFIRDHVLFFGGNGSPVFQGRSLIYRHAAVAPLFLAATKECSALSPGQTRRIASGAAKYFHDGGAFANGVPTLGWLGTFAPMVQEYSGPASPYWFSKAFIGLLLPESHPVWTAVEERSPVEQKDRLQFSAAPHYLLHSTAQDGIARVLNHGSDKYYGPGPDSPEYRRLAYSSHTAPLFTSAPVDNHFAVLDSHGVPSRRSRIHRLTAGSDQAASWHRPVWTDIEDESDSPWYVASATSAFQGYELRVHVVVKPGNRDGIVTVRDGGYALASNNAPPDHIHDFHDDKPGIMLSADGLCTGIWPLRGYDDAAVLDVANASPLGRHASCGYLTGATSRTRSVFASVVYLGAGKPQLLPSDCVITDDGQRVNARLALVTALTGVDTAKLSIDFETSNCHPSRTTQDARARSR